MSHIFISYSHVDTDYAHDVCRSLEDRGFTVWIDERIDYGERWQAVIEQQVDSCAVFLIIITTDALKSKWVSDELSRARRKEKRIFPLWLEGDLPLPLESLHYIDLTNEPKGTLPSLDFYQRLAKVAPRTPVKTPEWMAEIARERSLIMKRLEEIRQAAPEIELQPPEQNEAAFDEITRWEKYRRPGNNDYYGMTMLALALEAAGSYPQHAEAITHLRRAYKLEPRIIDKGWMNEIHHWDEDQHTRLERIIKDPKFWK